MANTAFSRRAFAPLSPASSRLLLASALLGLAGTAAPAADTDASWLGGAGVWSDTANWSGGVVPVNGQPLVSDTYDAFIGGIDDAVDLDLDVGLSRLTFTAGTLSLSQSAPLAIADAFDWSGGTLTSGSGNFLDLGSAANSLWSGTLAVTKVRVANAGTLTLADGIQVSV